MPTPIRVLIAPDKFKGTLSAHAAAEAMAEGVRHAAALQGAEVIIDLCPIADGGEGTAEVLAAAWNDDESNDSKGSSGAWHQAHVTGPLGTPVVARWFVSTNGRAAFDSASACGLALVPAHQRDPSRCTTRGVGELLRRALAHAGVPELLIGLGGSATVDAGIGMAGALGWHFEDASGRVIDSPVGADLSRIARATPPPEDSEIAARLRGVRVRVLCDVSTALIGAAGCASVFGPQKGATAVQVLELDAGLRILVSVTGVPPISRDGAAGGLGYGLRVFAGKGLGTASVTLESGAAVVLDTIGFDARAARADIVLTGEGRFDATSLEGKAVGEVIARSRLLRKRVIVVAGSVDRPGQLPHDDRVTLAACKGTGVQNNPSDAALRLADAAAGAIEAWLCRRQGWNA